jgi:protein-L-isoaspartate O-methyltransferase
VSAYGDLVAQSGLSAAHRLLLAAVPDRSVVLDVGCLEGYLAAALARRGCEVHGARARLGRRPAARGRDRGRLRAQRRALDVRRADAEPGRALARAPLSAR